ncbi:MAG TPA: formate dehydrogenase accessory sulfurtransferase FdhD [Deferrisomatales bacterium]|nr:formate dehydrogenase accessory sulfurtransferase FdhD [Deferrisomatales bacterium]
MKPEEEGGMGGSPELAPAPAHGEQRSVPTWVYDKTGGKKEGLQSVANERPITLYLNGRELVTLLCVGQHLDELAVGFLHGEGFLQRLSDFRGLEVDQEAGRVHVTTAREEALTQQLWEKRTVTSGCGKGSLFYYALNALMAKPVESSLRMTPQEVLARVGDLSRSSADLRRTHGAHTTGLATPSSMLVVRDDIGRHNAVDMIVGHCFLREIALRDKLLVTTGRLTSEIIIKSAKLGLSTIVSLHAATSLAIELATSLQITLIGYARRGTFTVYSGGERISG